MKTNVLSVMVLGVLLSVGVRAQSSTTTAEQEARRQTREQKVEKSKGELKEMGQDVKQKAKQTGSAIDRKINEDPVRAQKVERTKGELKEMGQDAKQKAKQTGDAIDRKVDERKARRAMKGDAR